MKPRPWHERLNDELNRRGVSARFRQRFLAEMRDHVDDLTERMPEMNESMIEKRLGTPVELAEFAVDQYRRATWTHRHPLIVFGLLPIPLSLLLLATLVFALELLLFVIGSWCFGWDLTSWPRSFIVPVAFALAWSMKFLPFLALVWFFTRRFLKSGVSTKWCVLALAQVLFMAFTFESAIRYSEAPGESAWLLGFTWIPLPPVDRWNVTFWSLLSWSPLLQFMVPLVFAWVMMRGNRRARLDLPQGL